LNDDTDKTHVPRSGSEVSVAPNQLWQTALAELKTKVPANHFTNWFDNTSIASFRDDVVQIASPNPFQATTLSSRYAPQVERVLASILGRKVRAEFVVANGAPETARPPRPGRRERSEPTPRPAQETAPVATPQPGTTVRPVQPTLRPSRFGLIEGYTFETYVVGSSNQFANAAARNVAEHPGVQTNNPFFVHGGVGLGKTHLLHAIGHRALQLRPELTILYVTSETFTNEVINAIMRGKMEEFRNRYRSIDILMVDDIQFIAGKESTQEEFFHTFNALYQNGKQIILSSDKPPKSIAALEERMRSRFNGGLVADVQAPDFEMRTAILRTKATERGLRLGDDVAEYIASKDQRNIRELEGALNRILMLADATKRPLTLQLAMEALTDVTTTDRRQRITVDDVLRGVVEYYNVPERDLLGRQRKREIVMPRQVAMYLMRESTESSLVDIGRALGGRDHTTILHGIEKIEHLLETDTQLRSQIMNIRESLLTGGR